MSTLVGDNEVIGKSGKKSKRSKKKEIDEVEELINREDVEEDGLEKIGKKSKNSNKKKEMNDRVDVDIELEKFGKKSKKSKKKEMDGSEEMNDCVDVEEDGLKKIGKKIKKSKNKEMDVVEELNEHGDMKLEQDLESRVVKQKKKNKGNDMVSGEESLNGKSFEKFDTDNQPEKFKKKKKKYKRLSVPGVVSDFLDAVTTEEASSLSLNKREKKLKNANEHDVTIDPLPNDTQDEDDAVDKRKKKKAKRKNSEISENQDALNEKTGTEAKENNNFEGDAQKKKKMKRKKTLEEEDDDDKGKKNSAGEEDVENSVVDNGMVSIEKVKMKKKKRKNEEIADKDGHLSKAQDNNGKTVSRKKEKTKSLENDPKNPNSKEKKKVRFSQHVDVFPLSDEINSRNKENLEEHLVYGKRFTKEEDKIVRAAVEKYIESHCLGEKGLEMVMYCQSYKQTRHCWKEIASALPNRPYKSVYHRAHVLYQRGERLPWTREEEKMLLEQYDKHGNNWKLVAQEFKRHRLHVKDKWRRIKNERNKGDWSQEEYQNLFDLVNIDLEAKVKANEEKKSKHGMLRDNICWGAISDRLSTRSNETCCIKWYNQLTSPMVAEGIWADSDDYHLLHALVNLDACSIEDVDWDDLIDQRSGDLCRRRWDQMVLHIGLHGVKSFAEQVEVLAKRYCPELREAREAWDSKPLVP